MKYSYRYLHISRYYKADTELSRHQDQSGKPLVWRTKRRGSPSRILCWKQHFNAGNPTWNLCVPTPACQADRSVFGWGWEIMLESQSGFIISTVYIHLSIFRPSPLDKFSESFWRWTFYFLAHVYSLWALGDKPWVWNTFECWYGYPNHDIGANLYLHST